MSHEFHLTLAWTGDTSATFSKDGVVSEPGKQPIAVSSAPGYGGDAARWNPEEMMAAALANCHMLTFIALVAKRDIPVTSYVDDVTCTLATEGRVTKIGTIRLHPTITVKPGADLKKVALFFEKAHKYCFVANSITSEVILDPVIVEG